MLSQADSLPESESAKLGKNLVDRFYEGKAGSVVRSFYDEQGGAIALYLLRTRNEKLLVRMLKKVSSLNDDSFPQALVEVVSTMKSDSVKKAVLEVLQKSSSVTDSKSSLLRAMSFVEKAQKEKLNGIVPTARETVVKGYLSHKTNILDSSPENNRRIYVLALSCPPAIVSEFVDKMILTIADDRIGVFLLPLANIKGAIQGPEVVRRAQQRIAQLEQADQNGNPQFDKQMEEVERLRSLFGGPAKRPGTDSTGSDSKRAKQKPVGD
jgi:hypothetical protein